MEWPSDILQVTWFLVERVTYANCNCHVDSSHVSIAIIRVCVCVCPHDETKTAENAIIKLAER